MHSNDAKSTIQFLVNSKLAEEAYDIEAKNNGKIVIQASTKKGAQNAAASLLQLVVNAKQYPTGVYIPQLSIQDQPAYGWRGFMLDEARHFMGKEK